MKYVLCTATLFIASVGFGQRIQDWKHIADRSAESGDWETACHYYAQVYSADPSIFQSAVDYAEALRHVRRYTEALPLYEKAYAKDRGKLFPEGQFWLAMMQQQTGDYRQALKHFKKYQKKVRREPEAYHYRRCTQGIAGCEYALKARRNTTWVTLKSLEAPVNTAQSEMAPWLLEDSLLWYTVQYPKSARDTALFEVHRAELLADSSWTTLGPWHPESNDFHEGNAVLNPTGDAMYLTRCGLDGRCEIWCSRKAGETWEKPQRLSAVNGSGYSATQPHVGLVRGKEVLFYASDRPGGQGGLDIWWSELNNGIPAPPVNAGTSVNSPEDEVSPFYFDEILYFSSSWWPGFGGFDVFKCAGRPRNLGKPENMGFPLNGIGNDLYFRYFPAYDCGMMASNRPESASTGALPCCNDLYRVTFADSTRTASELDDPVFTSLETVNRYLPVTVYFHNDEPDPDSWDTTSTIAYDQAYRDYVHREPEYRRKAAKGASGETAEDIGLEVEEFFDVYVERGMEHLDQFAPLLLRELEKGLTVELRVRGFASPRAQSDYNVNLTKRRIHSLERFLRNWNNGQLLPHFNVTAPNGAELKVTALPFGEFQADENVSDALGDEAGSIYSRGARLERKIEIESVAMEEAVFPGVRIQTQSQTLDLGVIPPDFPVQGSLLLTNSGGEPAVIASIESGCGFTVAELADGAIAPGESTALEITFDPNGKRGIQQNVVQVFFEHQAAPIEVLVKAVVTD